MTNLRMGIAAGYERRLNNERLRGLKISNQANEILLKRTANQAQIENFKLSGVLVKDRSIQGGYRIDKTKFSNPTELLEFLQTYLPEVAEYGVYNDADELQGYEKMIMENIIGNFDENGKMKYLISGSRPDGKRGFFDRRRRKGESENGGDPADITGTSLDILLNVAGRRMIASSTNASNFADRSVLSQYEHPNIVNLKKGASTNLSNMSEILDIRQAAIDAKKIAGESKDEFLEIMESVISDPQLKGTGAVFELLKDLDQLWIAVGGDPSDIVPDNQRTSEESIETTNEGNIEGSPSGVDSSRTTSNTSFTFSEVELAESDPEKYQEFLKLKEELGSTEAKIEWVDRGETAGVSGLSSSQDGIPQDELLLNDADTIRKKYPQFFNSDGSQKTDAQLETESMAPGNVRPNVGPPPPAGPIDTKTMTRYGRKRWQDPTTGAYYSEITETFQTPDGRWINVPSVDENGQIIPNQVLEDRINSGDFMDPVTGKELPLFQNLEQAEFAADLKSQTIKSIVDRGDASALRELFTEEGVTNLEETMATLQDYLETDYNALDRSMNLIAGMTSNPEAALAEMERFNISGFRTTASELNPYIPETKPVEYSERLEKSKSIIEGIRFGQLMQNPNEGEYGFGYQDAGTGEFYSIKDLIAEVRGLTLSQNDPDMRNRSQAQINSDMDDIIDGSRAAFTAAAVQLGEETSYTKRVNIFGLFGRERWYASDASKDLIAPFIGGRANFNRDSLSGQEGNMRLLVGPGTAEEGGADIAGAAGVRVFNYPRIAFFDKGKETKASLPLGSIINMYPGNPQAAMDVLAQMVPEEDLARYDYNQLDQFYKNFLAAVAEYSSEEEVERRRNAAPAKNYTPQIGPF